MSTVILFSLLFVLGVYLGIGFVIGLRMREVSDLLPLLRKRQARVRTATEFSSSTVATSISLATVIMAFFELAEYFGIWLLWAAITTVMGLILVRVFARQIWRRMTVFKHRPTLHDFLGRQFHSLTLSRVSAICTSLGFLGAFAAELTVGSRFFAGLIPAVPSWTIVLILSTVAFLYTALGGFRAVIVTDRVQMISIWLLLLALPLFYIYYVLTHGGWAAGFENIPDNTLRLTVSGRAGLPFFLLGIFVINVPTFLSDMSVWQRIAGAEHRRTVTAGLWRGTIQAAATWTLLVLLACFVFMIVRPGQGVNPLVSLIEVIGGTGNPFGALILFITVVGLYGAMLSTASTLLIAVSHTLYADVFNPAGRQRVHEPTQSRRELNLSRIILVLIAVLSTLLVQVLSVAGFSIADLVFAIYGAQLGLCPLVLLALMGSREKLRALTGWAVTAVSAGFFVGWGTAIFAKITGRDTLIFLAPVWSLAASSMFLGLGWLADSVRRFRAENVNWILISSVIRARRAGLYRLVPADEPTRLDCLMDACARCCRVIGTPVVTDQEAERFDSQVLMTDDNTRFIRSEGGACTLLKDGLCSIYTVRPSGCREYPWYHIDGRLYYDRGCPGVKHDIDQRPPVEDIQPFDNFFPRTPKWIVRLVKKVCVSDKAPG